MDLARACWSRSIRSTASSRSRRRRAPSGALPSAPPARACASSRASASAVTGSPFTTAIAGGASLPFAGLPPQRPHPAKARAAAARASVRSGGCRRTAGARSDRYGCGVGAQLLHELVEVLRLLLAVQPGRDLRLHLVEPAAHLDLAPEDADEMEAVRLLDHRGSGLVVAELEDDLRDLLAVVLLELRLRLHREVAALVLRRG